MLSSRLSLGSVGHSEGQAPNTTERSRAGMHSRCPVPHCMAHRHIHRQRDIPPSILLSMTRPYSHSGKGPCAAQSDIGSVRLSPI